MEQTKTAPRPEKVAVVSEVRNRLDQASAAIFTEYRGLTVKDLSALRRSLRDAGGEYRIYKNTLVRFAAHDLGLEDVVPLLVGPTAIAFVDGDAVPVAKALRDYARTNTHLVVKGGVLGKKFMSQADTTALADLPPREVVLARLAGALAAPMQQFAGLLHQLDQELGTQSAPPATDPELTAAIERVLKPLPAHSPAAPEPHQDATAARRVIDAAQDRRRPRAR